MLIIVSETTVNFIFSFQFNSVFQSSWTSFSIFWRMTFYEFLEVLFYILLRINNSILNMKSFDIEQVSTTKLDFKLGCFDFGYQISKICPLLRLNLISVVSATIAPSSRGIPELTPEDALRIILANLNLVVPVCAALLVIIIAIIVICILRSSKGNHQKGQ